MRLFILTQKVDMSDPVLGFFHRWLEEFAKHYESVSVICLEEGEHDLPKNVRVLSLGKEKNKSTGYRLWSTVKLKYLFKFYQYIWRERKNYDKVFVHMNQEYVILGWAFWKIFKKKLFLWRNHAKGSFWTRCAVGASDKVFYTSSQSFTARFKKSVRMPVGIDTAFFKPNPDIQREPGSVLFLGRISPVKRVLEFVEWAKERDVPATIAGPILPQDKEYGEKVLKSLPPKARYVGPVSQEQALGLYQSHEMYVNMTPAGSFDKTILEAAACGMNLVVDNPEAKNLSVEGHSLERLMNRLKEEMQ